MAAGALAAAGSMGAAFVGGRYSRKSGEGGARPPRSGGEGDLAVMVGELGVRIEYLGASVQEIKDDLKTHRAEASASTRSILTMIDRLQEQINQLMRRRGP